jgi:CRISPR/Cas system-associated exonuclease Cas4 (RecB family)
MAKKFYQTTEFENLQKEWYEKLEKEGFNDLEKNESWDYIRPEVFSGGKEKAEYYLQASQFLQSHEFKSPVKKQIWELHCEGHSIRWIAAKLEKSSSSVFRAIKSTRKKMRAQYQITKAELKQLQKDLEEISKNNKEIHALAKFQGAIRRKNEKSQ